LPIQPGEKKKEMSLFDLQTVAFGSLKNATSIAKPFGFHPAFLLSLVNNNDRCPYFDPE
jgi:hypothetical protein